MLFPLIIIGSLLFSTNALAAKVADYAEPDQSVLDEVRKQNNEQLQKHEKTRLTNNGEQLNKILDARKHLASPALMEQAKSGTGINIPFLFNKEDSKKWLEKSEQYVSEYEENSQGLEAYGDRTPIVFVSFSMGEALIRRYMDEAKKTNSMVVLRGFYKNDMKETMMKIGEMIDKDNPSGIGIDPTLFSRFSIESVPAFVLPIEPIPRCMMNMECKIPAHVKAAGDVSIHYFLETVHRTGDDREKAISEQLLSKYEGVH